MVPLKGLSEQWIYIGMPGTGKSWAAREEVWAAARMTGGYVIAHDPADSFEDVGVRVPSRRYKSGESLAAGIAELGGSKVHIYDGPGDATVLIAKRIAEASMALAPQQGGKFRPTWLYSDEAVAAGGVSAHRLTPLWMDLLARRRHYGIAIAMTAQSAYFAHRSVLTLATRIRVYRTPDPADGKRLISVGLAPEDAQLLRQLPDRQFYEIRKGHVVHRPPSPG